MLTVHAALVANSLIGPIGRFSIASDLILIGRGPVLVGGDSVAVGRRLVLVRGRLIAVGRRLILVRGRLIAVGRRLILVRGGPIYCKQNRVVNDTPLFPMSKLLQICALRLVFRVSQSLAPNEL
jgi:hypothetical protein